MTKSTGKRKFQFKNYIPNDPALTPFGLWTPANRGFFDRFRTWLVDGGYGSTALNTYCVAVRLAIGYLNKPFQQIDPVTDLDAVRAYMQTRFTSQSTRTEYNKGLQKLAQFLTRPKNHTIQDINWPHYTDTLPDWMVEYLKEYLAHCRKSWRADLHHKSTRLLLCILTKSLRWMVSRHSMQSMLDLTPQIWFDYLESRLVVGISAPTVNRELHGLQAFTGYLDGAGIPINPRFLLVEPLKEGNRIPRDAPPENLRLIYQEIQKEVTSPEVNTRRMGHMDRAWYLLMLHAGLRTGEVRHLSLADIDWERRKLRIDQSKGMKDRFVYLSQAAAGALREYLDVRGVPQGRCDQVFLYRHQPLGSRYCAIRLNTYGSRCGVSITPHQLRHSCATMLLNAGAPVVTVQSILGHKRIDTTLRYARLYDGTISADYYEAMAKIEARMALELQPELVTANLDVLGLIQAIENSPLDANQQVMLNELKALLSLPIQNVKVH
jgi:site-specific recombinase XerD